ncbi:MAG TPA: uroporphyrinogen-III C-methyltransferase [Methanocorpusculum sp.]|nr:uroporphyrinogen-III C-methyltransferase [Methanocorpusculum sp.]
MTVYLVGSGPGGLGLLTAKAREIIDAAEVILYDQLPGDEILSTLPEGAEKIDVGKFGSRHTMKQADIESIMIEKAKTHSRVVRLKGGDPCVFGRGGEEMETLRAAGIDVEVIPGITSGIAVPENVGIPVTHRDYASSVTFVTGHEKTGGHGPDWNWIAKCPGSVVIYMGAKGLPKIARKLLNGGMKPDAKVAVIENGFRRNQKVTITSLKELPDSNGFQPPAIVIIGEVVSLYKNQ